MADITTITPARAKRPCPNPNVSYELGYAVGQLGWDRVILLFNAALGDLPNDLPLDIIQQRASPYKLTETDPNSARKLLEDFLTAAIAAVIEMNPKRPAELRGLTPEKLKHDHDVTNMEWLMSNIHLTTLDTHINELPHSITDRALWFWEVFKGVVANSLFNVYDPVLKSAVDKLFFAWQPRSLTTKSITIRGAGGCMSSRMSRPSEKFRFEPSRKFLLTAVRLKDGTNRDEPAGTR
ncbi:MAG: hypothetical protein ACRD4E_18540 [Bryobacteraceae bacterium]